TRRARGHPRREPPRAGHVPGPPGARRPDRYTKDHRRPIASTLPHTHANQHQGSMKPCSHTARYVLMALLLPMLALAACDSSNNGDGGPDGPDGFPGDARLLGMWVDQDYEHEYLHFEH